MPIFLTSVVSIAYFLMDIEVGNIFVARMSSLTPFEGLVLYGVLYCACQISVETRKKDLGDDSDKKE